MDVMSTSNWINVDLFTRDDWRRLSATITCAIHDKGLVRYEIAEKISQAGGTPLEQVLTVMGDLEKCRIWIASEANLRLNQFAASYVYLFLPHLENALGWDKGYATKVLLDTGTPAPELPEHGQAMAADLWAGMAPVEPEPEEDREPEPERIVAPGAFDIRNCQVPADLVKPLPLTVEAVPRPAGDRERVETPHGTVLGRRIDESLDPALFEYPATTEVTPEQAADDLAAIERAKLVGRLAELSTSYVDALEALAKFRPEIPMGAVIEARNSVTKAFGAAIQSVASKHLHEKE